MQGKSTIAVAALAASFMPAQAHADSAETPAIEWQTSLVTDAVGISRGTGSGVRTAGLFDAGADLSLEKLTNWQGARLHVRGIATFGSHPNDLARSVQGIDNIETGDSRARLYEFYLEQGFAGNRGSLRVGLSDLNSEFYMTGASGLLVGPAFGIGSELSATGPNGPSIFPSTALMARLHYESRHGVYVQAAVINAQTGLTGMKPGKGALLVAEAGVRTSGNVHFGLGGWTYTSKQPDLRDTDAAGRPVPRKAYGGYALFEARLAGGEERNLSVFARAGASDGKTSPYAGGWQAGLLVTRPFKARPESQLSIGINQAFTTRRFTLNMHDEGRCGHREEAGIELTYADKLAPWLTLQPFVQAVRNADHRHDSRRTMVYALRLRFDISPR